LSLDIIANLWAENRSLSEIGEALNTTRGVVVGVIWRARRAGDPRFQRRAPKPKLRKLKPIGEAVGAVRRAPAPVVRKTGVTFAALPADGCRYILSGESPRDFVWCGDRVERPGSPWCSHHATKVRSVSTARVSLRASSAR
jgi:hypothetical protein